MIENIEEYIKKLLNQFLNIQRPNLRIGAICLGGLGDTLDFWAWLAGCRRMFPNASITAYTGNGRESFDALIEEYSPADIAFPFKRHIKFWRFFRGEVLNSSWLSLVQSEREHYDIFFDLRPYGAGVYTKDSFSCPVWFEKAYHQILSHHTAGLASLGLNVIALRNLATGMDGTYDDIQFPLQEYPLPDAPYITIHHGGCTRPKLWYTDYWEEVTRWLNGQGFRVLQLGLSDEEYILGAEDLRNKTTLKQTAYILKHGIHHIDCEGSLVRLAQCGNIQTKCTVLGGATQKELFAFPQNNNLWLDICPPCAYAKEEFFQGECARKNEGEEIEHCCMRKLTPERVINSLEKELERKSPSLLKNMKNDSQIALMRLDGMGGTITLSDQAKKLYKKTGKKVILITRGYEILFEDNPYIERIINVGMKDWKECAFVMRNQFDPLAEIRFGLGKWHSNNGLKQNFDEFEALFEQFPKNFNLLRKYGLHHVQLTDKTMGLPYDEIEIEVFVDEKIDLGIEDFILINNGVDVIHGNMRQTKCWNGWDGLCSLIDRKVVQVGTLNDPPVTGALDIRGKTTLKQLIYLLRKAKGIVVTEGGLMHLSFASKSENVIVLGGPTQGPLFEYPGHKWINSYACGDCWSSTDDWYQRCPKDCDAVCMKTISPHRVSEVANENLV